MADCWTCGNAAAFACRHCGVTLCDRHAPRRDGATARCGKATCKAAQRALDARHPAATTAVPAIAPVTAEAVPVVLGSRAPTPSEVIEAPFEVETARILMGVPNELCPEGHVLDPGAVEPVCARCGASGDELEADLKALAEEVEEAGPSPWDPDEAQQVLTDHTPVLSDDGRATVQRIAFEAREVERMRAGFYLEPASTEDADDDSGDDATDELVDEPPRPEPRVSREVRRSRRKRDVRARTIGVRHIGRRDVEFDRRLYPEAAQRSLPLTRGDCQGGERPCPFVSCAWHLFLDVTDIGSIKVNFPDLLEEDGGIRFEDMPETCALDVADRGGVTLEGVADLTNVTRERVRQIEVRSFPMLAAGLAAFAESDWVAPELMVEVVDDLGEEKASQDTAA